MSRIKTVWFSGFLFTPIYIIFLFMYFINDLSLRKRLDREDNQPMLERGCNLPRLNPFDVSIFNETEDTPDRIICESEEYPLLFKTDLKSNLIMLKTPLVGCCIKKLFRRNGSDTDVSFTDLCWPITNTTTKIPDDYENIGIYCEIPRNSTSNGTDTTDTIEDRDLELQIVDILGLTRLKPEVESRIQNGGHNSTGFSVLILGLDGMSHMNLLRTMPKTHKYISQNLGGVGMNGYASVGTDTFPNQMAFLTGLTPEELATICRPYPTASLDDCPLVWKNFSDHGYRTSYVEDTPKMVAFNYVKEGFLSPPTDYYLRPLMLAQNEHMGHTLGGTGAAVCHGPRLCFDNVLNNVKELAEIMKSRKYFQFAWSNSLTHDYINLPKTIDDSVYDLFKNMKKVGHLQHTIVVFLSDHGLRWGDIRMTRQGQMEVRMPFLYVILPDMFSKKYPKAFKNLRENENRLTSPFDIHATLGHLLTMDSNIEDPTDYTRGISLFEAVPINRSCESAGIPAHFCVCNSLQPIPVNRTVVWTAAEHFVGHVNEKFKKLPQCEKLSLRNVTAAYFLLRQRATLELELDFSENDFVGQDVDIRLILETVPGNALFEATVSRDAGGNWTVASDSRVNMYKHQSHCIYSDPTMKNYCFCKELPKNGTR